jgi:DNA-binding NtrC family response regulator
VLVLDLMMPRLGGVQALPHIRSNFPDVAVVVLTGAPDESLRERAIALGAAAMLPKPLDLAILGMIIDSVTGAKERHANGAVAATAAGESPKPKILIVDDDDEIRSLLKDFVEGEEYEAVLVDDGFKALNLIVDNPPAVVLLDISMPRLGGIEALTAIRAIAPRTHVIMVSGNDDVAVAKQALSYGAFDYVQKPMDFGYLGRSIEAALSMSN